MKLTKSLFMLCAAGLSLCACNSDDIKDQLPEGYGAVTVKIANPTTRAITAASTGGVVNGDITLTVTHNYGESSVVLEYDEINDKYTIGTVNKTAGEEDGELTDTGIGYVFYGIGTPSKITAYMYEGKPSYDDVNITDMQQMPNVIPVYGEVTSFGTGADIKEGNTTYKNYTANIVMTIPVARLEVCVTAQDMSLFKSVELLGAYLDNIKPTANATAVDYYLKGDMSATKQATNTGDAAYAILSNSYLNDDGTYNSTKALAVSNGAFLPAKDGENKQYFAYNFYAGTNPEFKLLFKVTKKDDQAEIPTYQYAIIKEYKEGSTPIDLQNQNIYRIDINLNDENIQIDEEGASIEYALTATVQRAEWGVKTVTGEWAQ